MASEVFQRRTEISDAPGIAELIDSGSTVDLFGDVNIVTVIEKAVLGITAVDRQGKVVGHASFSDCPNVTSISPVEWHTVVAESFEADDIRPINTLFLSLLVASNADSEEITTELLRTLFVAASTTDNCVLALPSTVADATLGCLSTHFVSVPSRAGADTKNVRLFVCRRASLCPHLYVRPAEPEDFDDLVPIFQAQSEVLEQQYRAHEFFLAELIEAQNEQQRCLVAVVDDCAVGFLSLSGDVEISVLKSCFELSSFDTLASDNTFAIGLFCIAPAYASRSLDFMAAAFDIFSKHQYCVITMPHTVSEIPLLQHFAKAAAVPNSTLDHELWIMHRHTLLLDLEVRPYEASHRPEVVELVTSMEGSDDILRDLDAVVTTGVDIAEREIQGFVAISCGCVAGVTVFRSAQEDAPQFRAHYNIEEYILYLQHRSFEHAHLNHFTLNPALARHSKFVLREAMRLGGKSCVYFREFSAEDKGRMPMPYTPISILDSLVPVRHRRQIDYPLETLKSNVPSKRIRDSDPPASLLFLNRKLMLEPKIPVNVRVVVVGDSDTGLALLESLMMKPHLRLSNLSIIAPSATVTTGVRAVSREAEEFLSSTHAWTRDDKKRVSWGTFVNIIDDKLVSINRVDKMLSLESGVNIPYDILALTPGTEYVLGNATPEPIARIPNEVTTINNAQQAADFLDWAKTIDNEGNPIIVYGSTIDAFTAVHSLLKAGVQGKRILLALPKGPTPCFRAPDVAEIALEGVIDEGVDVREGYKLLGWEGDATVEQVQFSDAEGARVSVSCVACLCFHEKSVDPQYFHAANDCHLVFDGRLVVDNRFRTTDPHIYSAGSFTKFSRKFYASVDMQKRMNQNEKEAGQALASVLLSAIDPIAGPEPLLGERELPALCGPEIVSALLPGGLQYLYCGHGGIKQTTTSDPAGPKRLVTKSDANNNFFSLGIGDSFKVAELCLVATAGSFSAGNLLCIYGLHEKMLNSVVSRFDEGIVPDLFEYFRQTWSMAIYHDRFAEYIAEVTERVRQNPSVDVEQLEKVSLALGKMRVTQHDDDFAHEKDAKMLADAVACVSNDEVATVVKNRLMDFLTYNSYHLPMYSRPNSW